VNILQVYVTPQAFLLTYKPLL